MWGNEKQETPFNQALKNAHSALIRMGLDLEAGMSTDGTNRILREDYPSELENLRDFMFLEGSKVTAAQFKRMVCQYVRVLKHRATRRQKTRKKIFKLHLSNEGMWGSRRQWAYSEVVSRLLAHFGVTEPGNDLHPVFAIMLNPSGGIAGSGNLSFLTGDMHEPMIIHSVVHDAYGYVGCFHNVGPGYNYLAIKSIFKDKSPLVCQLPGVEETRRQMKQLGLLGDQGRKARMCEMILRRQQLVSGSEDIYPEGSLPTEEAIILDYESRMNTGFFKALAGFSKQLLLNIGMKTWKVSPN